MLSALMTEFFPVFKKKFLPAILLKKRIRLTAVYSGLSDFMHESGRCNKAFEFMVNCPYPPDRNRNNLFRLRQISLFI